MELLQDMLEKIDRQRRNKMMDEAMDITNNAATGIRLDVTFTSPNNLVLETLET